MEEKRFGLLTVHHEKRLDMFVLRLSGEFDYDCSQEFEKFVNELSSDELKKVVVNMEGLEWMDSTAAGVILNMFRIVRENRGRMIITNLSERVKKVFRLAKLDAILKICSSEEEAIQRYHHK